MTTPPRLASVGSECLGAILLLCNALVNPTRTHCPSSSFAHSSTPEFFTSLAMAFSPPQSAPYAIPYKGMPFTLVLWDSGDYKPSQGPRQSHKQGTAARRRPLYALSKPGIESVAHGYTCMTRGSDLESVTCTTGSLDCTKLESTH